MLVAISTYLKPVAEVDKHRSAHKKYFQALAETGNVIAAGRQDPAAGGLIIVNGITKSMLEAFLQNDPYVVAKVAEYKVIEFDPIMRHPSLESMFS